MIVRRLLALVLLLTALAPAARAAPPAGVLDPTPRTAVVSAFAPELAALTARATDKRRYAIGGARFTTARLEGRPVVLFLSGVSMVNAAMTTQMALDRFRITRIVFSGIAGGVDPGLDVGDVVVAERWAQYLESVMAREDAPGHFAPAPIESLTAAPFGMIFPKAVPVTGPSGVAEHRAGFDADPAMLAVARAIAPRVSLKRCVAAGPCLTRTPRVVVGGVGVSGPAFVDNAALRAWAFDAFHARVLDMESAAVAQVAYANGRPFIAFRSLSDLAGGDPGQNQAQVFFQLAADNSAEVVRAFLRASPQPFAR
jgi:adenosylhomocysteine nucleosidase